MKLQEFRSSSRASGRTSRLIEEAKRLASEGKAVYVIARNHEHIQRQIDFEFPNSGIKCEPTTPPEFDFGMMRVPGSHTNCVWLIDHYKIESDRTFAKMFEEMTRFDKPNENCT